MRNIDKPTAEKFILTNKKKRMIYHCLREFYFTELSEHYSSEGKRIPKIEIFKDFVRSRLVFLENISHSLEIEIFGDVFTALRFVYQNETIRLETYFGEKLKQSQPNPTKQL